MKLSNVAYTFMLLSFSIMLTNTQALHNTDGSGLNQVEQCLEECTELVKNKDTPCLTRGCRKRTLQDCVDRCTMLDLDDNDNHHRKMEAEPEEEVQVCKQTCNELRLDAIDECRKLDGADDEMHPSEFEGAAEVCKVAANEASRNCQDLCDGEGTDNDGDDDDDDDDNDRKMEAEPEEEVQVCKQTCNELRLDAIDECRKLDGADDEMHPSEFEGAAEVCKVAANEASRNCQDLCDGEGTDNDDDDDDDNDRKMEAEPEEEVQVCKQTCNELRLDAIDECRKLDGADDEMHPSEFEGAAEVCKVAANEASRNCQDLCDGEGTDNDGN